MSSISVSNQSSKPFELPRFELLHFPDEILLRIMHFLPVRDILAASEACKKLHGLSKDGQLWKFIFIHDFPKKYSVMHTTLLSRGLTSETENRWPILFKESYQIKQTVCSGSFSIQEEKLSKINRQATDEEFLYVVGRNVVAIAANEMRIFDLETGKLLKKMQGSDGEDDEEFPLVATAVKVQGNQIFAGFTDGKVKFYDVAKGKSCYLTDVDTQHPIISIDICEEKVFIMTSDGFLSIWQQKDEAFERIESVDTYPADEEEDEDERSGLVDYASLRNGKLLILLGNYDQFSTFKILKNSETGKTELELEKETSNELSYRKIFGYGDKMVAIPHHDPEWSLNVLHYQSHDILFSLAKAQGGEVSCHIVTPLNQLIVGNHNGKVIVSDFETGAILKSWQGHQRAVSHLEVLNDEHIMTASITQDRKTEIKFWDFEGNLLFEKSLPYPLLQLKASEEKIILSFEEDAIQIWDFKRIASSSQNLQYQDSVSKLKKVKSSG